MSNSSIRVLSLSRCKVWCCVSRTSAHIPNHNPFGSTVSHASVRQFNANRAAINKLKRTNYCRLYPTVLVFADGSTVNVRHTEPRAIIKLPKLYEECESEEERREWRSRRKVVEMMTLDDDDREVAFDSKQYLNLFKKNA